MTSLKIICKGQTTQVFSAKVCCEFFVGTCVEVLTDRASLPTEAWLSVCCGWICQRACVSTGHLLVSPPLCSTQQTCSWWPCVECLGRGCTQNKIKLKWKELRGLLSHRSMNVVFRTQRFCLYSCRLFLFAYPRKRSKHPRTHACLPFHGPSVA